MGQRPNSERLTHVDDHGAARMVDVGDKPVSRRTAVAEGYVRVSPELATAIRENTVKKGDVLGVARLAGIQAAKRTADLIPLCHPLALDHADVTAALDAERVHITATVSTEGKTGVEMEALTAVSVAALTIIDMGKSIDRAIVIESIRLLEKTGGTRGDFRADNAE